MNLRFEEIRRGYGAYNPDIATFLHQLYTVTNVTILQISWFVQTTYFEAPRIVIKKVWIGKGRFHLYSFLFEESFLGVHQFDIFHFDDLNVLSDCTSIHGIYPGWHIVCFSIYSQFTLEKGLWLMTQRWFHHHKARWWLNQPHLHKIHVKIGVKRTSLLKPSLKNASSPTDRSRNWWIRRHPTVPLNFREQNVTPHYEFPHPIWASCSFQPSKAHSHHPSRKVNVFCL